MQTFISGCDVGIIRFKILLYAKDKKIYSDFNIDIYFVILFPTTKLKSVINQNKIKMNGNNITVC